MRTTVGGGHSAGGIKYDAGHASVLERPVKRALDLAVAVPLLVLLAPVILLIAALIVVESPGPAFYRCRRVGRGGSDLLMLKFRKMHHRAEGPALAAAQDERFTRLGPFLARTKLDEVPQLWNVLKGDMSLVGPRPEDPTFVAERQDDYEPILAVAPGMTGLSQLAFARESEILDPNDRVGHYLNGILPQKIRLDRFYAEHRSIGLDLRVLFWTARAILLGREVAVNRQTGQMSPRAPRDAIEPIPAEQAQG